VLNCLHLYGTSFNILGGEKNSTLLKFIIGEIVVAIDSHIETIKEYSVSPEALIILFNALQDWIVYVPPDLLFHTEFSLAFFPAIEAALNCEEYLEEVFGFFPTCALLFLSTTC